jgi:hypothetical protein
MVCQSIRYERVLVHAASNADPEDPPRARPLSFSHAASLTVAVISTARPSTQGDRQVIKVSDLSSEEGRDACQMLEDHDDAPRSGWGIATPMGPVSIQAEDMRPDWWLDPWWNNNNIHRVTALRGGWLHRGQRLRVEFIPIGPLGSLTPCKPSVFA